MLFESEQQTRHSPEISTFHAGIELFASGLYHRFRKFKEMSISGFPVRPDGVVQITSIFR